MKLVHYWERVRPRVVRHGYTPGIKKIRNQNVRRAVGLLNTVKWYMLHPGYIFHSGLYYSNMELVITNKCTLKCRKCCHYIYKYQNTAHIPAQVLIEDMKKLLDSIRWVDEFRVLGGEPLLHPELCEIVTFLLSSKRIGRVEIVTNGTLSPSQGMLDLFPNKRLNISVSNYGNLSCKIGDFTSNTAINATVSPVDHVWFDHGDLTYQGRTEQELIKQYSVCNKDRCVILNGKLYNCACSAFGADMEIFELKPGEYVDIRGAGNGEQLRTQLNTLKRRSYFTSCNYCYWGTDRFVPIRPAEQIKK